MKIAIIGWGSLLWEPGGNFGDAIELSLHVCLDESLVVRDAAQLNLEPFPELRFGGFPKRVPTESVVTKLGDGPSRQLFTPTSEVGNKREQIMSAEAQSGQLAVKDFVPLVSSGIQPLPQALEVRSDERFD